jgi:glycosyltransferase involved in cell wall biosynthesis
MFPMGDGDGNYLLFIGRMGGLKGEGIAAQVSMATGIPLKVVGSGPPPALGEYLGIVKPQERARLMGAATAVLTPSQFPEPFCLVAVEAQMCGTPVLCTPWGAFTETVQDGKTGFRCYSVDEFSEAVQHIASLDRFYIRQRAIALYSTEAIAPQYDKYFARLPKIMKIPKHMDLCALHSDPTSNSWMPEKIPTHRS